VRGLVSSYEGLRYSAAVDARATGPCLTSQHTPWEHRRAVGFNYRVLPQKTAHSRAHEAYVKLAVGRSRRSSPQSTYGWPGLLASEGQTCWPALTGASKRM